MVKVAKANYHNFAPLRRALTELNSIYSSLNLDFAMTKYIFRSSIVSYYWKYLFLLILRNYY